MRFYMPKKERDTLMRVLDLHQQILSAEGASAEDRERAEEQIAIISGMLVRPLFPTGFVRNVLMVGFVVIGILAFLSPYEWLFWSFFIALAFSPRIVGGLAFRCGTWSGGN